VVVAAASVAPPVAPAPPAPTKASAAPRSIDPAAVAMNGLAFGAFAAVDGWAKAWASKDVAGYLAAYGKAFVPPDGLARAAWEAQRAERIRAPKQISVLLAQRDLVIAADGERATMRFVQTYRSDRFNGSAWKTLELARDGGRWQIVAERAGR
jgi:ketosteroid isomerase-like protein